MDHVQKNSSSLSTLKWLAIIIFVVFAGVVAIVASGQPIAIDQRIATWPRPNPEPALLTLASVVRVVASTASFVLVPLVSIMIWRRQRTAALILAGNFLASAAISVFVKLIVSRPRPAHGDGLRAVGDETSFPSTSVVTAIAFWGVAAALAIQSGGWTRWRRILVLNAVVLIVLIGPSRLYVGDHWFTDVVAGYLWGLTTLLISMWLFQRDLVRNPGRSRPGGIASLDRS